MTLLVKLGSSIVAADDGELRVDVLDSVCEQVAALEQGGERVVLVTSGAIARGMQDAGAADPAAGDGRAAGRFGGRARAISSAPMSSASRGTGPTPPRCS